MKRERELVMAVIVCRCLLSRSPTIDYGTNDYSGTQKINQ